MIKKIIPTCWVCLLLLIAKVNAQQLAGKVIDQYAKPIAAATLVLVGIDDSVSQQSTTSLNGAFVFNKLKANNYKLMVSHIGFKKHLVFIKINKFRATTLPDIVLLPNDKDTLAEVSITTRKAYIEQKTDRIVVNVNSLISNLGATTADALNQSPGVEVNENSISLHGRDGVVILIDDRHTHLAGKDLIDYLKALPAGTLDKIEIMDNPPARYNADGTAGIINIKTKKATANGFNGTVNISYSEGIRSKSTNSFNLNYKLGKVNIFASGSYGLNDNYYSVNWSRVYSDAPAQSSPVLNQHNVENSTTHNFNYRAGFDYDVGKSTSLNLLFSGFTVPYTEHGIYNLRLSAIDNVIDSNVAVQSELRQRTSYSSLNLNLRHKFKQPERELNLSLDYLDHHVHSDQSSVSDTYLPDNSRKSTYILFTDNSFPAQVYGSRIDYNDQFPGGLKVGTGIQSTLSIRNNAGNYSNQFGGIVQPNDSLSNTFHSEENINSAYISLQKSFKKLELQVGLRAENTNAMANQQRKGITGSLIHFNYTDLFPTAYVLYKPDSLSRDVLNLSLSRRIDRPNYADLNPSVFFFDRYTSYTGNPLLQPAYSTNIAFTYTHGSLLTAGIQYSNTKNQSLQVYTLVNQTVLLNNYNVAKATIYSLYINPSLSIANWLTMNIYTELNRSNYEGIVGNNILLDTHITSVRGTANAQFKLNKGWSAELSGLYRGKRSGGQGFNLPLWQLNTAIQKKLWKDKAAFNLATRDIFHTYIINRSVSVQQVQLSRIITADTQLISLSFSYKFGKAFKTRGYKNGIEGEASRIGGN